MARIENDIMGIEGRVGGLTTYIRNGTAIKEGYYSDSDKVTLFFGPNSVSFNFIWSPAKLLKSKETTDDDLSQICLILSNRVYNEKGRENLDKALYALNLVDDDEDALSANLNKTDKYP